MYTHRHTHTHIYIYIYIAGQDFNFYRNLVKNKLLFIFLKHIETFNKTFQN